MKVRVKCFAAAREIVGAGELVIELPDGSTVRQLVDRLRQQFPGLEGLAGSLLTSVNREYATAETPLRPEDEVALIPPVSGGASV
jgi:molybdopterin converting factor subunit 1